jgi:hypothetical protein
VNKQGDGRGRSRPVGRAEPLHWRIWKEGMCSKALDDDLVAGSDRPAAYVYIELFSFLICSVS